MGAKVRARAVSYTHLLMATGARVSNTYPTCRLLLASLLKGRLIMRTDRKSVV